MTVKDDYHHIFAHKTRILCVFSHPDDAEIYAGGTIARLVKDQKNVRLIKVSSGNRGSRQEKISSAELQLLREKEDRSAAQVLGVQPENNVYLRLNDGDIDNSHNTIGLIAFQIRLFKPDLIITHNPEDTIIRFDSGINWVNHRDHRHTGLSTLDAAYPYSRDLLFFPEHRVKDTQALTHTVTEFLLVDYYHHPDLVYIDVSDTTSTRTAAIAAHTSQYSATEAQKSTDFFTKRPQFGIKRYESFRHVITD